MTRGVPIVVAAVLIAVAFAGGYFFRTGVIAPGDGGGQALAQTSTPAPSPRGSPPGGQRERADRAVVVGTVESLQNRTLVVKVMSARGVKVDNGAIYTAQVEADATILREATLAELKKGNTVTLRGSISDGKFVVRSVTIDLR